MHAAHGHSVTALPACRFTLVYVLYSTAIATPGHGSLSPLALGFTVYVGVVAGAHSCCLQPHLLHAWETACVGHHPCF